jgi:TRAP-type C4-dicarboxylate transport system permease small subunit
MASDGSRGPLGTLLRVLAFGGGAVLLGLMALVAFDIVMRRVLKLPFLGGYEMTELAMVVIVGVGLPYCAAASGHVSVDLFGKFLDRPGLRWLNAAVHFAGAALFAIVAWRCVVYAYGSYRWGDATNMMAIPKFPFQLVTALGAALFAAVLLGQASRALGGPARGGDGAP